jgi:hypothetical protein
MKLQKLVFHITHKLSNMTIPLVKPIVSLYVALKIFSVMLKIHKTLWAWIFILHLPLARIDYKEQVHTKSEQKLAAFLQLAISLWEEFDGGDKVCQRMGGCCEQTLVIFLPLSSFSLTLLRWTIQLASWVWVISETLITDVIEICLGQTYLGDEVAHMSVGLLPVTSEYSSFFHKKSSNSNEYTTFYMT